MNLQELTVRELLDASRQATLRCVGRYRELADSCDPGDQPLHRLMETQAADERPYSDEIGRLALETASPGEERLDAPACRKLISDHLPSLDRRLGEGPLDRDVAMYLAECLQEESCRFHRVLAECASDEEAQTLLERVAVRECGHLAQLRSVLL